MNKACVQLIPDDHSPGLWKDVPCSTNETYYYICEMEPEVDTTADPIPSCQFNGQADPDYFPYFGYCYKIITTKLSFEDAKLQCEATGDDAFLASVRSGYHENIMLSLMLGANETSSWIGLQSSNGLFRWVDRNAVRFTKWGAKEPKLDMSSTTNGCVSMNENGDWFSGDCSEVKSAICAITTDEVIVPEPTYGECPEDWTKEGYDCYYYVHENMTWKEAQQKCQDIYVDASISVPHGRNQFNWDEYNIPGFTDIWIGVFKNEDEKFETVDDSVLDFVNWASGQPENMKPEEDCLIVSITEQGGSSWSGQHCDNKHTFFCAFPQITAPRDTGECKSGWFKFKNKCYQHFNERLTFGEAQKECKSKAIGGDLAGVNSGQLQALLSYLMKPWAGGDSTGDVWIGLWDTTNERQFQWTNGDKYGYYENWAPGQPDGYLDFFDDTVDKNDCVKMKADPTRPGLWDDVSCSTTKLTYLCECYLDPTLPTPEPDPTSPCQKDYKPLLNSCYRVVEDVKTFNESQQDCAKDGANLASIHNGYEQGLMQFLLAVSSTATSAWIGINDEDNDGEYTLIDGWPVSYVNWDINNAPSRGMCVTLRPSGFWLESKCDGAHASICKQFEDVPVTPFPEASHCDDGWVHYQPTKTCYLINTYKLPNDVSNVYINYADAKKSCQNLGASLVTLHSPEQNSWFYGQVRLTLGQRKIWLGMHRSVEGLLHWDDGSLVNYVNWAPGEPSVVLQGTDCVTFYAGNEGLGQWSDTSCFELNAYACQKDAYPGQPPVCEPGWDHNPLRSNDCYYLHLPVNGVLSWHEAEAYCNGMGSHLASILSFDDKSFLSFLLKQRLEHNPESWPWVGFRRKPGSDFAWSDGSQVLGIWWSDGQPDSDDDDCAAVELEGAFNTLNNINCGLRRPFICKKKPSWSIPITSTPTARPHGFCSDHGSRIGNKCYKLMMEPLSWDDAREVCAKSSNGDLASVPVYAVQALLASLFKLVDMDNIWIGMTSRMPSDNFAKEFHWIDGSNLIFTNWGSGQPSLSNSEGQCVKMRTDPDAPGKWYDDKCEHQYPYICQHDLDSDVTPEPPGTLAPCPSGYEGAGSSCFKIETVEQTFSNAMDKCQRDGDILAPVMDGFENALIDLLMFSAGIESAWIGMQSSEETSGKYEWSASEWPETYINWGDKEPSTKTGCVTSIYSKGWKSVDCTNSAAFICRSGKDTPPTEPPIAPGLECPEMWYPFNEQCYLINTGFTSDDLLNAYFKCSSIGAMPPSIHSRSENVFIRNNAIHEVTGRFIWLGLVLEEGRYRWMDGTPVDYTNWADGEESVTDDGMQCVWMVPEWEGRWQKQDCTQQAEVVCMLSQLGTPQPSTESPSSTTVKKVAEAEGVSTGALVGTIVGGCLIALSVILCVCYYCEKQSEELEKKNSRDSSHGIASGLNAQSAPDVELQEKETDSSSHARDSEDTDSQDETL